MTNREFHDQQRKERKERQAYLMTIPEYAKLKHEFDTFMRLSGQHDECIEEDRRFERRFSFVAGFVLAVIIMLIIH